MPFGNITSQTITFEPRKPGVYQKAGTAIGAPTFEFRFSAGTPNKKTGMVSVSMSRISEKDWTASGTTSVVRKSMVHSVNILIPTDGSFTAADAAYGVGDFAAVLTAALLQRLASGEI